MDDVYNNVNDYNPDKKRKILIVFDDMIDDSMTNKKCQAIIKELFIRCKKLNVSLVFIAVLFFCPEKINSTHYLIIRFTTKESYKALLLIIKQTLIRKNSLGKCK